MSIHSALCLVYRRNPPWFLGVFCFLFVIFFLFFFLCLPLCFGFGSFSSPFAPFFVSLSLPFSLLFLWGFFELFPLALELTGHHMGFRRHSDDFGLFGEFSKLETAINGYPRVCSRETKKEMMMWPIDASGDASGSCRYRCLKCLNMCHFVQIHGLFQSRRGLMWQLIPQKLYFTSPVDVAMMTWQPMPRRWYFTEGITW